MNRIFHAIFYKMKTDPLHSQQHFHKFGSRVRLTEAISSEFVAKHTTIPVPRVLDVFNYDGSVYIIQEFINAPMLLTVWRSLGPDDRKKCMIQLKGYLEQLRSLVPPEPGKVQSVNGEGFTDFRLGHDNWGPFESHDEMHEFFLHDHIRSRPDRFRHAQAPLAVIKGRKWRTVFAHGDIGPHNILWDTKKAEIAAIIDWEYAGWFPEYWEYTRAFHGPASALKNYGWWEMFQDYVDCYHEELEADKIISAYLSLNI